jgi:hypothetical protein
MAAELLVRKIVPSSSAIRKLSSFPERCRALDYCVLRRGQGLRPFPRAPFSTSSALPPLRSGQLSLDEGDHFPAQSRSQRRYAPIVFGIIPECRSPSIRKGRSASPESHVDPKRLTTWRIRKAIADGLRACGLLSKISISFPEKELRALDRSVFLEAELFGDLLRKYKLPTRVMSLRGRRGLAADQ